MVMVFKSISDNQTDQQEASGDQETIPSPEETPEETPEESQDDGFVQDAQENFENGHSSGSDPEQIEVDRQEESRDQQEEIGQNAQNESDLGQGGSLVDIDAADQGPAALETVVPAKEAKQIEKTETETETIYQTVYLESSSDPAASGTLEYSAESYYLLTVICSVLLFFFLVCICKYIYKFFNIFF